MEKTTFDMRLDALEDQLYDSLGCIENFRPDENKTRLELERSFKGLLDVSAEFGDTRAKNIQGLAEELLSTRELSEPFLERMHLALQLDAF